jgi:PAS domain S-box-containing protein
VGTFPVAEKPTYEELAKRVKELEIEKLQAKIINGPLIKSSEWLSDKLDLQPSPEISSLDVDLESIIDAEEIQSIMDDFCYLTNMVTAVLDLKGKVIAATGWQDICTKFHRINPKTAQNCTESDLFLAKNLKPGEYIEYKCKNGLWDVVTPLYVGTKHLGNIFTGQFFYDDEKIDEDFFIKQADKYGFDKDSYLESFKRIPRYNRDTIDHLMGFLVKFTTYISKISLSNIQLEKEIKKRKKTENALRISEENLATTLHSIGDGVISTDKNGLIVQMNPMAENLCGWKLVDAAGKPLAEVFRIVNAQTREIVADPVKKVLESKGVVSLTNHTVLISKNGREYQIADSAAPIKTKEGEIRGVVLVFSDVTEKYLDQEQIKESEERYRALLQNLEAGIVVHALDTSIIMNNPRASELLGLSNDQMKGKVAVDPDWKFVNEDNMPLSFEEYPVNRILTSKKPIRNQILGIHRPGTKDIIWVTVNGFLMLDGTGDFSEIVISFIDITERKLAEAALLEYDEDLKESQRIAHVGSWRLDISTNKVTWSEELYKMYGFDPSLPPPPYNEQHKIFTPESWDRLSRALTETIETKIPYELELETVRKDGSNGWMWVRGEVVLDATGKINGLRGAAQDITERKLTEKTLRESKAFLDNLNDIAYMVDAHKNVTWVNVAIEKITGFAPEAVIGKSFLRLFIEEDHASLIDVYKRTLGGESLENYLTFTSGKICHFTSLPHRNINGDIIGTFGIARDITESRRTEAALKESEDRLRKAQKVARIGNWEYDIPTGKVWGSEEAFRIYGIERKTSLLPIDEVESCIIEAKRVNQSLIDLINKKVAYDIEFEINPVNREGLTVIHSIAELACDASGNPVTVLGVMQDITESKAREKEHIKLLSQLQQAQKMESIGTLAGGVAHDFNNMLGVILGHTEMIMDQMDSSHLYFSNLQEIQSAAMRSADLTRQLLAFARKQTISPNVLDLNKMVDGMLNMLLRLIGEDIDLVWLPGKKLWPVNIDPSQIDQIIANLCVNARDAIAGVGKLTIETGICTFDESYCAVHMGFIPGEYVFLAVSDNGSGMDAKTQAKIFEPFFTTKPMDKGTGLGLSTVYGIVKQNNGFINVYSEPGQGTTFKIYLSRHTSNADHVRKKDSTEPSIHGNETILLVEDEPAILNLTTMMLQRLGYTVLAASTPGEAIRLAREHMGKIDLLMTDVVMPEMNGRDLAKNLLSLNPSLKRLFMSGYTANVIAHHGVLDEGVHFIQKPFSKKDLADSVKKALEE